MQKIYLKKTQNNITQNTDYLKSKNYIYIYK